jgi:hypothetical protein
MLFIKMVSMKKMILLYYCSLIFICQASAQELYPYTDPASNVPAGSVSVKLGTMYNRSIHADGIGQRYMPEITYGINKNWMIRGGITLSNMHQKEFIFESVRLYGKYRFLSIDDVHKHFRMAAFATAAYSRNPLHHNELNLMGDHSGFNAGVVATQLLHKLALSASGSITQMLDESRSNKITPRRYAYEAFNYTFSAGYLILPREYRDYKQTNLNLYVELLGARNLDLKGHYTDLAPALQLIFNSNSKLNLMYRFQLAGSFQRMAKESVGISFERTFLR